MSTSIDVGHQFIVFVYLRAVSTWLYIPSTLGTIPPFHLIGITAIFSNSAIYPEAEKSLAILNPDRTS